MPATDPLAYESRTPGALEPGETVLWEDAPLTLRRPPSGRAVFVVSSIALVVLLPAGVLMATAGLMPPVLLFILLLAAAGGIAWWALRRRREAEVTFRVTDRRLVRAPQQGSAAEFRLSDLMSFRFETRRSYTTCRIDGGDQEGEAVAFERLADPAAVQRLLAGLPDRVGRRRTLRRGSRPSLAASATIGATVHEAQPPSDPAHADAELPLGTGEVVLWAGRPRARDPRDVTWILDRLKIAAWMLVPAATLVAHIGVGRFRFGHWAMTGVAVIWILLSLHALTLGPWLAVRRRRRTRYFLTNMRAVEDVTGRTRVTRSAFLDMVSESTVTVRDGVVGDLHLLGGSFNFERVDNVWALHRTAMEAVRGAGDDHGAEADGA